jgi:23S rRNA (adenine2503-C2)-methyltransferase
LTLPFPADLKNLRQEELIEFVKDLSLPAYRGRQIFSWLYRRKATSFDEMTDLPKELRKVLAEQSTISSLVPIKILRSKDNTCKMAFRLEDGALIESVLIPEENRYTLCLSSQVGCAMGCTFCQTARIGFKRNLTTAEIINQVLAAEKFLSERDEPPLSNLVFMGMGEPLANFDNLVRSIDILEDQRGLDFSKRKITVSTCGLLPKMQLLGKHTKINLAVSLHAATDTVRNSLMPINRTYPLDRLLQAMRDYPLARRKRIMIEYILLADINDSLEDARLLAKILRGLRCKINLLPYNQTGDKKFKRPSQERIDQFQQILWEAGYTVIMRSSRGDDIGAACGQLAGRLEEGEKSPS